MKNKTLFLGIGLFALIVFLLMFAFVPVSATPTISKTRCELVDSWLKPTSEPLAEYWNENVGVDCNG